MECSKAVKVLMEACKDTTMEISMSENRGIEIYWEGLKVEVKPNEINKALKAIFVLHDLEAEQS